MFWLWIGGAMVVVIGLSVLAGKTIGKPRGNHGRQDQITALKASGALRNRKESRP
ncbi:MAG: hypothetical protein R3C25_14325 [Hyphomonadaceae bacterium]